MAKKKQKEKNNTGRRRSGVAATAILSLLLLVVSFCALLFLFGYICYIQETGYANLWLLYLAAAVLSSAAAAFYGAGRLPIKGILTGLAYALGSAVLHAAVIGFANPDAAGFRALVIFCAVIAASLTGAVLGSQMRHRKRRRTG